MNTNKLQNTLDLHGKWLRCEDGGQRANLRGSNLRDSNLRRSDLSRSNLRRSNLRGSDLRDSNLRGSNLHDSDLRGSNLSRSNLDFSAWPLWCGSLGTKCGHRLFSQLLYHLASLDVSGADEKTKTAMTAVRALPGVNDFRDTYHTELDKIDQEG